MTSKSVFIFCACTVFAAACVTEGGPATRPTSDAEAAQANLNLGIGYLRQDRPDVAIDALQRALNLNPRLAMAHSVIALAYDQIQNPELAEEHHLRATQLEPRNGDLQNSYAVFLCRQNRWADAERYFERAIDTAANAAPQTAMLNAATCARTAGDLEGAEEYFRAALGVDPTIADALSGMLELSYVTENYLQARAFSQRRFAVGAPGPRDLLLCYMTEQALNDTDAAADCAGQLREQYAGSQELSQLRELQRNGR